MALDEQLVVGRPTNVGRFALLVVVMALLLVGMLAGVAGLGNLRTDDRLSTDDVASNGWVAFSRGGWNSRGQVEQATELDPR